MNSLQTVINAVLGVAVAVLFFLHFSSRSVGGAAKPAAIATTAATADSATTATTAATTPEIPTPPETPVAEQTPAVTAAAAALPAPTAATKGKIAYVESGKLLDGYQGMKDARKAFETKAKGWERQNQTLLTGFKTAVEQYQKSADGLTAEQRAATEQKLGAQQQQVAQQQQQLQQQAQEEEAKLTSTVLGRINKQVEAYGKARGYQLILIAAPSGTIAYGQKDLDITAPVLTYLNSEYRKK
ncbi:OmpH family outer membrane protein [uncultured Hymenobacter sp.]|uniref:OmpH family outer membrane protein n=1 Tax=uncultured Hymenobacter sp. TaxID=170016 RepID=UPI0035CB3F0F